MHHLGSIQKLEKSIINIMKTIKKTITVALALIVIVAGSVIIRKNVIEVRKQSRLQTSVEYKKMIEEFIF